MNRILTESQVREVLAEWHRTPQGRRHGLQSYLAQVYSVSVPTIRSIVTGRTWHFLQRGYDDAQQQMQRSARSRISAVASK
jgi:hypothetical protein